MSSSSIPDSFSMKELEKLANNAVREETVSADANSDEWDQERIIDLADRFVLGALDEFNEPIVHKAMVFRILSNMVEWHTRQALELANAGDEKCATAWMRDAGKFQAAMTIIADINIGDNDFITPRD